MVGDASSSRAFVVDTSPLIYLAKIGALDVLMADAPALMTMAVRDEALLPRAAYRFPEIVEIEAAINAGLIRVTPLTTEESAIADSVMARIPALGRGEREVIAISIERSMHAVMFDRRARRVASALGASVVDVFEVVARGTGDLELLERRIRALAALVNLRIGPLEALLEQIGTRR